MTVIHAMFEDEDGPDALCGASGGELTRELSTVNCEACQGEVSRLVQFSLETTMASSAPSPERLITGACGHLCGVRLPCGAPSFECGCLVTPALSPTGGTEDCLDIQDMRPLVRTVRDAWLRWRSPR